jgi:hypothetical protein
MNDSLPGWDSYSYGFHSDDGKAFEYKLGMVYRVNMNILIII